LHTDFSVDLLAATFPATFPRVYTTMSQFSLRSCSPYRLWDWVEKYRAADARPHACFSCCIAAR